MSTEFSPEAQKEIIDGLVADSNRLQMFFQQRVNTNRTMGLYEEIAYRDLESLVYITEQIRMKLKLLGAPRIN